MTDCVLQIANDFGGIDVLICSAGIAEYVPDSMEPAEAPD